MPTTYADVQWAARKAKRLIRDAGFEDMVTIGPYIMTVDDEELAEMGQSAADWVGMYVAGSLEDSPQGLTVVVNLDHHETREELLDTVLHECGHALWELISPQGRRRWIRAAKSHSWGPEEAFADNFMYLLQGRSSAMTAPTVFREVTELEPS